MKMPNIIRILLPIFPQNAKEIFFKGYIGVSDDNTVTIHITKYTTNNELWPEKQKRSDNAVYGYYGDYLPKKVSSRFFNFIIIEHNPILKINKLIQDGNHVSTSNCIFMLYDYDSIKDSQAICNITDDYFTKLVHLIHEEQGQLIRIDDETNFRNTQWLSFSMFLQHIYNYWKLIDWLISTIKRDKKVSNTLGNLSSNTYSTMLLCSMYKG